MQVTQQFFVAEEWVWDAHNEAKVEAQSRAEVEKSLGAFKQEQAELPDKLTTLERAHLSAETFLKSLEAQVEDQRKQQHITETELAT